MNNLLQFLSGLLIAALIALFAAPYFIDWNQYKAEIETQASRLMGRKLAVAGDVQLHLLPAPYLKLENIVVTAPTEGEAPPPLIEADAFKLWLAAPPLLRGVIEVEEIELINPVLRIALKDNGVSNWSMVDQAQPHGLPFVPKAVSLQSMKIRNGALQIDDKDIRGGQLRLTGLNGELSAVSLQGPFKFDGTLGERGSRLSLQINTGRIDQQGTMPVKSVLRNTDTGHRYSFDGSILKVTEAPSLNGVISASFPFLQTQIEKGDKDNANKVLRGEPLEVKTAINADATKADFDKILVTIVHNNRPQMMTGKGLLTWKDGKLDLNGSLGSRLVDLDHLRDGLKLGTSVSAAIGDLIDGIRKQAGKVDSGHFTIELGQIKLNGDLIQDIDFKLSRNEGGLEIERLSASLPGDNIVTVSGRFDSADIDAGFQGKGLLRGQNLGRLVNWATGASMDEKTNNPISARPFNLSSGVVLNSRMWALKGVSGDVADTAFSGEMSYLKPADDKQGEISLKLATGALDTTALVGRPLAMREVIDTLREDNSGSKTATSGGTGLASIISNNALKLELRAGRVRLEDFDGQDLIADLYYGTNRIDITELSIRSPSGLLIKADGLIDNLETNPSGSVTGVVNVETPDEVRAFASWIDGAKADRLTASQIRALAPLRLAVMLQTEAGTKSDAIIRVNGVAGSSHIGFKNTVIGSNLFSRQDPLKIEQLEVSGVIDNEDGKVILTQLLPYLPVEHSELAGIGRSKVWFNAAGLPTQGLHSRVEFNSDPITAGFDGRLGWEQGGSKLSGQTHLEANNAAAGLAVMGLDTAGTSVEGPLKLSTQLEKNGDHYRISEIEGTIGSAEVQGRADLNLAPEQRKLNLKLLTSSLDLSTLFSPLLQPAPKMAEQVHTKKELQNADELTKLVERSIKEAPQTIVSILPSRPFDTERLRDVKADISISAEKMTLGDKLTVNDGELSLAIADRKIHINKLGGKLWNGNFESKGMLNLSSTIATLDGELSLQQADLGKSSLRADGMAVATGQLGLNLKFAGRGLSPAGLLSLINGSGHLSIENGRINRINSAVLDDIVEDELTNWGQSEDHQQTSFTERFKRHFLNGDLDIGNFSHDLKITDGTIDLKTGNEVGNVSRVDFDAHLSLTALTTHIRVTIRPLAGAKHPDLPLATAVFEGELSDTNAIVPTFETSSLEQYLKVVKMENDVRLLEKLAKQDEEIANRSAIRRRNQQMQKQEQGAPVPQQIPDGATAPVEGQSAVDTPNADNTAAATNQAEATSAEKQPQKTSKRPSWNPFSDTLGGMR